MAGCGSSSAWPELAAFPSYGLIRPRLDFDEVLVRQAQKAGARLHEQTTVTEPVLDDRTGRVAGVGARTGRGGAATTFRAPVVLAADGVSARLALALGIRRREDRPMGVAVRRYYTSPRTGDDFMESHLELWDGPRGRSRLLPGYGWIFGVGDGTVNVGLGILNTSAAFQHTDYRELLVRWLAAQPTEWGLTEDAATGPVRGGALPMGFNRKPHHTRGLLLLGDAGGMVNPFNGEGIAYAMESAETAADVVQQALARPTARDRERVLDSYPERLRQQYGGYFTAGTAVRRPHGQPLGHAPGHALRAAAPGPDAAAAQADGQPDGSARRGRVRPRRQRPVSARAGRLTAGSAGRPSEAKRGMTEPRAGRRAPFSLG